MNYQQAQDQSFLVPWKATECFSGTDCWCRIIVPVEPIYYTHPESPDIKREFGIVDAGNLDQQTAEYFVQLHNERLENMKRDLNKIVKEEISDEIYSCNSCKALTYKNGLIDGLCRYCLAVPKTVENTELK
jgi:hypothetical protein